MKTMAVDDEKLVLADIVRQLKSIERIDEAVGFCNALVALSYIEENTVDVAFLDINMRPMDGLTLAKRIKELSPKTYIIFVTGYSQYAVEAFKLKVGGYLMKPVTVENIEIELDYVKAPEQSKTVESRIRVQTFNGFDIFVDGKAVTFPRAKSKELLAYLIDKKGQSATTKEIAAVLWEDKPYTITQKKLFPRCAE